MGFSNSWFRFGAGLFLLVATAVIGFLLVPVLIPVIIALITAYCFHPLVVSLEKRRISRTLTIAGIASVMVIVVIFLPLLLLTGVIHEADLLIRAAKTGLRDAPYDQWLDKLPLRELVDYMGWAPPDTPEYNERAVLAEKVGAAVKSNALQFLRSYGDQLAGAGRKAGVSAAQFIGSIGGFTLKIIGFLVDFSLFAFVTVYLLRDYDDLVAAIRSLIPPRYLARTSDILGKIDLQLRSFLRGQLTVCVALMVLYGIGLFCAGVPFALPIALFGGAASFIPYVGPSITIIPSLLFTLLYHGVDGHILWVFVAFGTVQMIESYLLTPRIVGSQVGLNPVWVIISILVFSSLLGFLGVLIAVPLAAVIKVLVLEALAVYRRSPVFLTETESSSESSNSSDS